jgi:integrase
MVVGSKSKNGKMSSDTGSLDALLGDDENYVPISDDWADMFRDYINDKKAENKLNTVKYYQLHAGQIIEWAVEHKISLKDFMQKHMNLFVIYRRKQNVDEGTVRKAQQVIKNMMAFSKRQGYVQINRFTDYKLTKLRRKRQRWVPDDLMVKFVDGGIDTFYSAAKRPVMKNLCLAHRQFYHLRFKAFMFILIDTGCRPDELLKIEMQDIIECLKWRPEDSSKQTPKQFLKERPSADGPKVIFRYTKNGDTRAVPISPLSLDILKAWLRKRPQRHGVAPTDLVFTANPEGDTGTKVDYRGLLRTLYNVQEWLGIPKVEQYSFYCFRRTTASAMAADNLVDARDYLGHKNISTTNTYLYTSEQSVADTHARVAPLERFHRKK